MRLLLVEDDPLIGPAMRAVLSGAGHEVLGPSRGSTKALRLAQRESPDLAFVDYHLAGGEDGLSLARTLKEELGIPSLLVTGFPHRAQDGRDVALGFLHKPFHPGTLLATVEALENILAGRAPSSIPSGLFLFTEAAPAV